MLKKLSCAYGISGFEEEIISMLIKEIKPYATKVTLDSFGNLYAFKKGTNSKKTIALFSHTDEVGLIVSDITDDGYLKFRTVGGIDSAVLLGKRVVVGKDRLSGVIGSRAVHLLSEQEKKEKISIDKLYIDIGARDKIEAEKYVQKGAPVFFEGFWYETDSCLFGKAFDDRAGCYILTELIKETYENDIYFVFTAQEETGLRGALVASRRVEADEYIVVENTTCLDLPSVPSQKTSTVLGDGTALSVVDGASFADVSLREELKASGEKIQFKNMATGGNDAGAVSTNGKRVASVSVPCRYLHTPVGVISKSDISNTLNMLKTFLKGDK